MKNKIIFTILIFIVISTVITTYNMCYAASTLMTDENIKEAINTYNNQSEESYTYEVSGNTITQVCGTGDRYDITYDLTSNPVFTSSIEVNSQTKVHELANINNIMQLPFLGLYIEKIINGESIENAIKYASSQTTGVPYGAKLNFTAFDDELTYMDGTTFKDGEYDITDFVNYAYGGARKSYNDSDEAYSYTFNVNESSNSTSSNKSYVISLSLTVNENKVNQNQNQNNNQQSETPQTTNSEKTPSATTTPTNTNIIKEDKTTATKIIPKTGISYLIISLIGIALVTLIICKKNLDKYKGI